MLERKETLSVQDIESYGTDIQSDISSSITEMMKQAKLIDLDSVGNQLQELSDVADKAVKGSRLSNLPILSSAKRWLKRYESVESRLASISKSVTEEQEKLEGVLSALMESKDYLRGKSVELGDCAMELQDYVDWLKVNPESDEDGLKMQAAVNRLKIITTTKAVVEQEIVKSVLVIKENKEIQQQLTETATNLIPMFNTMMMNTLASKANTEAIKIRKAMIKTANHLVVENARQIEKNADELVAGRTDSIVDQKSIQEANQILQKTVRKVIESSKVETTQNLALVESLKKQSSNLSSMIAMIETSNSDMEQPVA